MKLAVFNRVILVCLILFSSTQSALLERLPEGNLWSHIFSYCDGDNQFVNLYAHKLPQNEMLLTNIVSAYIALQDHFVKEAEVSDIINRHFKRFDDKSREKIRNIFKIFIQSFKLHDYRDSMDTTDLENFFNKIKYEPLEEKNVIINEYHAEDDLKKRIVLSKKFVQIFHYCLDYKRTAFPKTAFLLQYKVGNYIFSTDREMMRPALLFLLYWFGAVINFATWRSFSDMHDTQVIFYSIITFVVIGSIMVVKNNDYFDELQKDESLFFTYELTRQILLQKKRQKNLKNKLLIENFHG